MSATRAVVVRTGEPLRRTRGEQTMRSIAIAAIMFFCTVVAAAGQAIPTGSMVSGDAAVTYHWVRSNTQPGECGCFDLSGGSLSGSWSFHPRWAAVSEISGEYAGNGPSTGNSLTLASFLAGVRYSLPNSWQRGTHGLQPFGQLLLGASHSGGGIAGEGDGAFAFATRRGGGIDLPVRSHFAVRIIQIDYDLTEFRNSINNHQNNLLLGCGIVFRWTRVK